MVGPNETVVATDGARLSSRRRAGCSRSLAEASSQSPAAGSPNNEVANNSVSGGRPGAISTAPWGGETVHAECTRKRPATRTLVQVTALRGAVCKTVGWPYFGSNQASAPSAGPGKSPRSRLPVSSNASGSKPFRRCSADTSLPISGCLAPSRRGNAVLSARPDQCDAP
jgi:hypothetical protein